SRAARRRGLFDKRASIGGTVAHIIDLDDHDRAPVAARIGAQQREDAALDFDAAVAVALGGIVQVEPAADRRAAVARGRVGRLHARAVAAPVDPELFAVAGVRAARDRLDAPGRLQVARAAAVVLRHALVGQEYLVVARRHGAAFRRAELGGRLEAGQAAGGAETAMAGPVQSLAVVDHVVLHGYPPCGCGFDKTLRRAARSRPS